MDRDNSDTGNPEMHSLPNGKRLAIVNLVDEMVKREAKSEIVPLPKGPYVYIAKGRGTSYEAAKFT